MGIIVECNDQEIWNPSLRVGKLFMAQIKSLEEALDIESGIAFCMADIIEIDEQAFNEFISEGLRILEETNNGPLFFLISNPLKIAVSLHMKITGNWPQMSDRLQPFLIECKNVMKPFHI